ncbi:MAG: cyclodeaminase/cyclohydrolase family protein [Solobacterium sp.]|nr:cyclodeaminase/cyclohydrolase family protein [Solobacterium sp.]
MKNMTLDTFTAAAASKRPVPGGGGVSALAGSLAASLAEMVTQLTTGKKRYAEYEEEIQQLMREAEELRIELLSCIEKDAEAFAPLAAAYGMDRNAEGYRERLEACLRAAAEPPFLILKLCTRVVEIDERLSAIGSKLAVSDAGTSVMLAHGAMYGAYLNVKVNTRLMQDKMYAEEKEEEAEDLLEEYAERALNCFEAVEERLDG